MWGTLKSLNLAIVPDQGEMRTGTYTVNNHCKPKQNWNSCFSSFSTGKAEYFRDERKGKFYAEEGGWRSVFVLFTSTFLGYFQTNLQKIVQLCDFIQFDLSVLNCLLYQSIKLVKWQFYVAP